MADLRILDARLKARWPATRSLGIMVGFVVLAGVVATIRQMARVTHGQPAAADGRLLISVWGRVAAGAFWFISLGVLLDHAWRSANRAIIFAQFGAILGAWAVAGKLLLVNQRHTPIWPDAFVMTVLAAVVSATAFWLGYLTARALGLDDQ